MNYMWSDAFINVDQNNRVTKLKLLLQIGAAVSLNGLHFDLTWEVVE